MSSKNCLITGGAGFVGSHLAEKMIDRGWKITIIDNLSTGKLENLKKIKKQVKFINADIRNFAKLRKENLKTDVIVHLAAQIYVSKSILSPKETFDINLGGTINILELAKKIGVKRVVFASSSAVYGNISKENIPEKEILKPISPYGLSKLMTEEMLALYSELYGITTTSLRFFNIYGSRQDGNSPYSGAIPSFLEKLKNEKKPVIYGNGKQTRDFIYVTDAINVIFKAVLLNDGKNHIYNVGTGNTISINNLLNLIMTLKDKRDKLFPIYKPKRVGDIQLSGANISRLKKELGFKPKYTLREGLKLMAEIF